MIRLELSVKNVVEQAQGVKGNNQAKKADRERTRAPTRSICTPERLADHSGERPFLSSV